MYAAPPVLEFELFARVPESLHVKGRTTEWLEGRFHGTPTSFLEGPSFDRAGNLYCVDIPYGRILKVSPAGVFEVVVEYDGEPNGLKIHKDGRIFIADQKRGILILDPATRVLTPLVTRIGLEGLKGPNDLVFASNGDLYFTDQGQTGWQDPTGRLVRVAADGRVEIVLRNIPSPNGLVLSADEQTLFLAVTRANEIWKVPLLKTGGPGKVGTFIHLSGSGGPDGVAIDEEGSIAVCHPGVGSVWIFSKKGEPLWRIRADKFGSSTTNIAYGGPDRRTIYITESSSGSILTARVPVPGRVMYSHT